jgi:hypothetical protein
MRTYLLAAVTAAMFALPTSAFSEDIHIGPGGVRIERDYHGYGRRCHRLREACIHKGELGERGEGNCRRYREICG